jgi:spermidine synthase
MMRISSALFEYHYAFVAVSIAILGMGLGGFLMVKLGPKISQRGVARVLAEASVALSLLIAIITMFVLSLNHVHVYVYSILMLVPFVCTGFVFAAIFKTFSLNSQLIYFFDLSGAAVGSLLALYLFDSVSVIDTVFLLSITSSLGSVLFALASKRKRTVLITLFVLLFSSAVFMQNGVASYETLLRGDGKALFLRLDDENLGARIIRSEWGAYGRTDLVEYDVDPHVKILYTDGSAGARMYHFDGFFNSQNTSVSKLYNTTAYFPFYFGEKERVLVIGAGGGVDVLISLMGGAEQIIAVEVNPETVEMVGEYSNYNGGIYSNYDEVSVVIDEGRSFLRRSSLKYDVIMLNIPISKTSQGISGYALAENYLFTVDSFKDYLDHLTDQGRLVVVAHHRVEIYKLTTLALTVLDDVEESREASMRHIVITEMKHSHDPVFILKKSAFDLQEIEDVKLLSLNLGFTPLFFPNTDPEQLDPILTQLANDEVSLDSAIWSFRKYLNIDVEPPSDDKPFFYKFESGIPSTLSSLLIGASLVCLVFVSVYHRSSKGQKRKGAVHRKFFPYYFALLGVGFMLIEVSLMQKFILFLGHPTLAMSIILFSLLVSSGVGGLCSRKVVRDELRRALKITSLIVAAIIVYLVVMPSVLNVLLGLGLTIRVIVTGVLIFPLGFLMGIPFPSGVSILNKTSGDSVPWMWCLNGVFSLLGSVIAVALAMIHGFNAVLLLGAFMYSSIFVIGLIVQG